MYLVVVGALIIGASLGLLGSGGSILTVPALRYLVDQPEKVAIGESLAIVGGISLIGALPYILKRTVDWRSVLLFGLPGMAGTWIGALVSTYISGTVQMLAFSAVMLLASVFMLRPVGPAGAASGGAEHQRAIWKISIDGLVVGIITGIVGVGGGFLIVPALVVLGGLSMRRAVGTSLLIIALKSFSGFAKYLDVLHQKGLEVDPQIIALFIGIGALGGLAGGKASSHLPQQGLQRGFAVLLLVMGIVIPIVELS